MKYTVLIEAFLLSPTPSFIFPGTHSQGSCAGRMEEPGETKIGFLCYILVQGIFISIY